MTEALPIHGTKELELTDRFARLRSYRDTDRTFSEEFLKSPLGPQASWAILTLPLQRAVRGACAKIVEDYGGEVPRTIAELITLPGVARKTANIVQGNSYPEEHAKDPDAGVAVTIIAIPASGSNITRTFGSFDLRGIQ